jgi:hypothetical protein
VIPRGLADYNDIHSSCHPQSAIPVLISGVVSFFQIHVQREYITAGDEEDDYLYRMALEMQQRLRHEMQEQVRSTLGPEFQVQSFDIRKGIWLLLRHL